VLPWGDPEGLALIQTKLGVDILISGHTHKQEVYECNGKYFVNPGSATGAYSPLDTNIVPSFVLMAIKDDKVVTYVYELYDGEVKVSKSEHCKSKSNKSG
jgi:vacuolar protein sorting-associated protein 29